jgi:UDP-N-acetylglucosamine/UDP-N-acetylgalactosamine diphosphorylase
MTVSYNEAKTFLDQNDQSHVLQFWETLTGDQKARLLAQIDTLDSDAIALIRELLARIDGDMKEEQSECCDMVPAEVIKLAGQTREDAVREGGQALRDGAVGVLLVAGGQGTRLGYDGPKGAFPIGPITGASLFEIHSRKILGLEQKYGASIPFYIMTSQANDVATRAFFAEKDFFGLSPKDVMFFTQGMWPAFWKDGHVIMDRNDHIFMSPDGHGGTLSALRKEGMLEDMRARGLKAVFYFQVDNPLVDIASPAFVGAHLQRNADVSVKVCAKRDPGEGLGVVVERAGTNAIVEYTELTEQQKHEKTEDGQLRFLYGSVAIHVFSLDFLVKAAEMSLPLHQAHKKIPYCDEDGTCTTPDKPNGYKFEKFIFDVLPCAQKSLNVEFAREDEFSPVKNASGSDSPATAQRDMILKSVRWLEACGVEVPKDAAGHPRHRIEIDPCFATAPEDLCGKLESGFRITGDAMLA